MLWTDSCLLTRVRDTPRWVRAGSIVSHTPCALHFGGCVLDPLSPPQYAQSGPVLSCDAVSCVCLWLPNALPSCDPWCRRAEQDPSATRTEYAMSPIAMSFVDLCASGVLQALGKLPLACLFSLQARLSSPQQARLSSSQQARLSSSLHCTVVAALSLMPITSCQFCRPRCASIALNCLHCPPLP